MTKRPLFWWILAVVSVIATVLSPAFNSGWATLLTTIAPCVIVVVAVIVTLERINNK